MAVAAEACRYRGFLATRCKKKRQVGAHRDNTCDEKTRQGLLKSRLKEWTNWKDFSAVHIVAETSRPSRRSALM